MRLVLAALAVALLSCCAPVLEHRDYRACAERVTASGRRYLDVGTVVGTRVDGARRVYLFLSDRNRGDRRNTIEVERVTTTCPQLEWMASAERGVW